VKRQIDEFLGRSLSRWVGWVQSRAIPVVSIILVLTLGLGLYAALHLGVNSDNVRLVAEDIPSRRNHEAFTAIFPNLENALLIVVEGETAERTRSAADALWQTLRTQSDRYHDVYLPGGGEFFERNGLLYRTIDDLAAFGDEMARLQPILAELERDGSIANLASIVRLGLTHARENQTTDDWTAVLDQVSHATVSLYREYPLAVSWEAVLLRGSPLDVVKRRVIVVDPILDFNSILAAGRALDHIREAAASLDLRPEQGVRIRITGNPALNYEEMFNVMWDIVYAAGFCFVLVAAVLWVALRSKRLVFATIATLLVGLVWTAAFAAVSIGHLNLVSVSFAVLFIGLGVDFAIHLSMAYANCLRHGKSNEEALRDSAAQVGSSLVICAFTTAIGFYAFVPTDYRGVAELGLIAGTGIFITLFQTLTLLPALLSLWLRVPVTSLTADLHFHNRW